MNKIYKIPRIIIFIFLLIFITGSLLIGFCILVSEPIRNLFVNLGAGGITVLMTIFGIDWLIQRSNKMRWKDAEETAKSDIVSFTNQLTSYVASPLGFEVTDYELDSSNIEASSRDVLRNIIQEILKIDVKKILTSMDQNQWYNMMPNIFIIRQSFIENTQLYSTILPPEILGKLLKVRKSFNSFDNTFGLVSQFFIKDQAEWPVNKEGLEKNKAIRASFLSSFSRYLQEYFKQLDKLIDLVDIWKKEL